MPWLYNAHGPAPEHAFTGLSMSRLGCNINKCNIKIFVF